MKKALRLSGISLATILLLSSTAFAGTSSTTYKGYKGEAPCPAPKMLMSGFYLGGQIGYDSYRVRENINIDVDADGTADTANPTVDATGWVGGLFAGYGQYLSQYFYLGGEVLGNYSGAQSNYSIGTYNSKFNAYGTWGLALLPGLRLGNESLLYVRLGYDWTRMRSQESVTGLPTVSKNQWSGGFVYGLGLESLIVDNWSVRTEYTHTNNRSFSSGAPYSTSFNPSDNQFMVGLVYHFA